MGLVCESWELLYMDALLVLPLGRVVSILLGRLRQLLPPFLLLLPRALRALS